MKFNLLALAILLAFSTATSAETLSTNENNHTQGQVQRNTPSQWASDVVGDSLANTTTNNKNSGMDANMIPWNNGNRFKMPTWNSNNNSFNVPTWGNNTMPWSGNGFNMPWGANVNGFNPWRNSFNSPWSGNSFSPWGGNGFNSPWNSNFAIPQWGSNNGFVPWGNQRYVPNAYMPTPVPYNYMQPMQLVTPAPSTKMVKPFVAPTTAPVPAK